MVSNCWFTVQETLDAIFGDSDFEMEEETSGSDSQSDNDNDVNMESASKRKMESGLNDFNADMSADEENLLRAHGARCGITCE